MARRTNKGVVRTVGGLALRASDRQRKLYGLKGSRTPQHERERSWLDARYMRDLDTHPEAKLWLSVYNEEVHRGVWMAGEPHIHNIEQLRELDRERKARVRDEDVMSFSKHRQVSVDQVVHPEEWLAGETGVRPGDEEDRRIAEIDRARAVALRKEEP